VALGLEPGQLGFGAWALLDISGFARKYTHLYNPINHPCSFLKKEVIFENNRYPGASQVYVCTSVVTVKH
jgi:hypothetical protein